MSAATQAAARRYIERGYAPIPVPANSKNPNRTGWESERWTIEGVPDAWNNGQNIGLLTGEPSGWLVDVDLDCPEAARAAEHFLPPTLTSGRASSPGSHRWYVSPDTENGEWKDADGKKKLIELRSTGRQTLVEPSAHTSGERYAWRRSGTKIAEIGAADLRARCTELATAVLVARHLPEHRDAGAGAATTTPWPWPAFYCARAASTRISPSRSSKLHGTPRVGRTRALSEKPIGTLKASSGIPQRI